MHATQEEEEMKTAHCLVVGLLILAPAAFAQGIVKPTVTPKEQGQTAKPGPKAVVRVVPVTGTGKNASDFCRLNASGKGLIVRLQNLGEARAPQQSVAVTFRTDEGPDRQVRQSTAIAPGRSVNVTFVLPAGCSSPDCAFSIRRSNQPTIRGMCVG